MSVQKIIQDFKKQNFKPVYWIEGDEAFFIDEVIDYAEKNILTESEASFNLSVFYGKDTDWATVLNACRKYPMFGNKQVVIIKEAQQMKDIDKLEGYIENPLVSTILVIAYKDKKLDARTKFSKVVKAKGEVLTTKKLSDNQLPEWISMLLANKQLSISPKAQAILIENIGNDLSRIKTEIEKLSVNLGNRKSITEDDIETYIGVSKDYNIFELQNALTQKNLSKALKIIQYFDKNPKAAPIQLILPSLYSFFSKVYVAQAMRGSDEKSIAEAIGLNSTYFLKDYLQATKNYSIENIEKILLLLNYYNLKSIGIDSATNSDGELLKEFIVKATL